jgi:hypothetical protein
MMMRVARRLFIAASATSLLLCIACVALWIRSYPRFDVVVNPRASVPSGEWRTQIFAWSFRGELCVGRTRQSDDYFGEGAWHAFAGDQAEAAYAWIGSIARVPLTWRRGVGPFVIGTNTTPNGSYSFAHLPIWAVGCPFAVLPALWILQNAKRIRQRRKGLCRACGYDLRASTDRCPECGTPIAQREGAAG